MCDWGGGRVAAADLYFKLEINSFYSSSLDIPARAVPRVRKERVHTDLRLGIQEVQLGFAILETDGIVALDFYDLIDIGSF